MILYKLPADLWFLIAVLILIVKMARAKSCAGISARSQILLAIVNMCRCKINLNSYNWSYDDITSAVFFISSILILIQILCVYRRTYEEKNDVFLTEILLIPCFMLALWTPLDMTAAQIGTFLESVAIMPQFHLIFKAQQMETSMVYYLMAMGLNKILYFLDRALDLNFADTDMETFAADLLYMFLYVLMIGILFFNRIKVTGETISSILYRRIASTNKAELSTPLNHDDEKTNLESKPDIEKV